MVRMITDELLDFLRAQLAEGMSTSELEELLIAEGGWTSEDVAEALRRVNEPLPKAPTSPLAPETTSAEKAVTSTANEVVPPLPIITAPPSDSPSRRDDVPPPASLTVSPPVSSEPATEPSLSLATPATPVEEGVMPTLPQEVTPPPAPVVTPSVPPSEPLLPSLKEEGTPHVSQPEASSLIATTPSVKEVEPSVVVPAPSAVVASVKPSDTPVVSSPVTVSPVAPEGAPLASFRPLPLSSLDRVSGPSQAKDEPVDDFLGIFSGESSGHTLAPMSPSVSIPMFAQPSPVPLSGDEFTLDVDESEARAMITPSVSIPSSAPKTPSSGPFVFGKKPEWSFRDMLEQKRTPMEGRYKELTPSTSALTPEPVTEEKIVQFDLSKITGATTEDTAGSLPEPSASEEKKVETRSLAEVWASGGEKGEKKEVHAPKPYISSTPRTPVPKKRTMNSDLLLHEQRTTNTVPSPAVPSVNLPSIEIAPTKRTAGGDVLLRGKGASMPSIPAVSDEMLPSPAPLPSTITLPESPSSSTLKTKKPLTKSTLVTSKTPISLAEELRRKNKIKRILGSTLIVLLLSLVFGGLLFMMFSLRGSNTSDVLRSLVSDITTTPSFAYRGSASSSLSLVSNVDGAERSGRIDFDLLFSGSVRNTPDGFGDGTHQIDIKGDLLTADHEWGADVKANVHVVGDALYFSLLRYPEGSDIDPEVAATYWVKVDLSAVMRELALQGAATPDGNYGSFGGGRGDSSFAALYSRHNPFVFEDTLPDEVLDGRAVKRFLLRAEPESMSDFLIALYRKYTGDELKLTSDEALRFKNAAAKITAEAWVDSETEQLVQLFVRADLDDDIVGVRVRGPVRIDVRLSGHGQALNVTTPTPFLTLEEFWVRINDYKKNKDLRVRDAAKRDTLQKLITALSAYREREGKFPLTLLDLRTKRDLTTGEVSDIALRSFIYVPYVSSSDLSRVGRCGPRTGCAYYHLGVNFEDLTNPHLRTDADVVSEISGRDSAGCAGERDRACFDIVSVETASSGVQ